MAFDKENLKMLFIQLCGKEMIRYISPDMDTPVYCLYNKFFRLLEESDIPIIKRFDFLKEVNSFNVVSLDLNTGQWGIVELEKVTDTRTITEKFSIDKKIKKMIRDKQADSAKNIFEKLSDGLRKTKDVIFKRDGDDFDNQNPS